MLRQLILGSTPNAELYRNWFKLSCELTIGNLDAVGFDQNNLEK
jgi:hypothetical protein